MVMFDMGGVIVRLNPIEELLADGAMSAEEFWPKWLASPTVRNFERGGLSADEFGRDLVVELGLAMTGDELLDRFSRFPAGLYPGAEDLVAAVVDRVDVGVLSNTNALHWDTQIDADRLKAMFPRPHLSYEIGLVKPDREVFDHVAADLGAAPDRILFIDDNRINVDGAIAAGWRAEVAKGPEAAAEVLRRYEIIN